MSALTSELRGLAARALAVMPAIASNASTRKLLIAIVAMDDADLARAFPPAALREAIDTIRTSVEEAENLKRQLDTESN